MAIDDLGHEAISLTGSQAASSPKRRMASKIVDVRATSAGAPLSAPAEGPELGKKRYEHVSGIVPEVNEPLAVQ
jgi:hypothetical protein